MSTDQTLRTLAIELRQGLYDALDRHPSSVLLDRAINDAEGLLYSLYKARQGNARHRLVAAWWLGRLSLRAETARGHQPDDVVLAIGQWVIRNGELLDLLSPPEA